MNGQLFVCDAQVHAPEMDGLPEMAEPPLHPYGSIGRERLEQEMAAAGVSRVVLVPLPERNGVCQSWALQEPDRYLVMGSLDLAAFLASGPSEQQRTLDEWMAPGMKGLRLSLFEEEHRALLTDGGLEWLWEWAEGAGVPLMVLVPEMADAVLPIARAHPGLRLTIDHFGLLPRKTYTTFEAVVHQLEAVSVCPNVSVKLTQLPRAVQEDYPFPTVHRPVRQVLDVFGADRVFWGSDLTTLPCTYRQAVGYCAQEIPMSDDERRLVMGQALCRWLDWE